MNTDPWLFELARYLESQIPGHASAGALPVSRSTSPLPPTSLIAGLLERQLACNPMARRLILARRNPASPGVIRPDGTVDRDAVRSLADIPAVPVGAFKELDLSTVPAEARVAEFHSSGTTGHRPSRHAHSAATLAIYRLALEAWFKRRMLGDLDWDWNDDALGPATGPIPATQDSGHGSGEPAMTLISLTPAPEAARHSSLAFMIGTLMERIQPGRSLAHAFTGRMGTDGWELDLAAVRSALEMAATTGTPVVVLGTAFNFVHLADALTSRGESFRLPPGSRVMETGGYKGRSREIPREELHDLIALILGVPHARIGCEYGMSELSSQAYDVRDGAVPGTNRPLRGVANAVGPRPARRLVFPPWCHARVVSPETGRELPDGEPGLLQIIDLANVASVLGVQTEDLAVRHADGLELLGRAARAEARGCSLLPSELTSR